MSIFEESANRVTFPTGPTVTLDDDYFSSMIPGKTDTAALLGDEAKRRSEPLYTLGSFSGKTKFSELPQESPAGTRYVETVIVDGFRVPKALAEKVDKTLSFIRPEDAKNKESAITLSNAVNQNQTKVLFIGFLILVYLLARTQLGE